MRSVKDSWEGLHFGSCSQRPLQHMGPLRIPTQMQPPPLPPCRKPWSDISGSGHSCLEKRLFTYRVTSNYTSPTRWGGEKSSFQAPFPPGSPPSPTPEQPTKAPFCCQLHFLTQITLSRPGSAGSNAHYAKSFPSHPVTFSNRETKWPSILFTNRNTVKKLGEKMVLLVRVIWTLLILLPPLTIGDLSERSYLQCWVSMKSAREANTPTSELATICDMDSSWPVKCVNPRNTN